MIIARRITRILLLLGVLTIPFFVYAQSAKPQFPPSTGHINDFAAVLDQGTVDQLETVLRNFDERTGAQIAVVTVKTLDGRPIEEYANELYRAWGLGAKTGPNKDKGALLLIATDDRRSRLEVGYGLEGDLPDGLAGEMLRRMRPSFQTLNWSEGVTVGVRTLIATLAQKWNISIEGIDQRYAYPGSAEDSGEGGLPLSIIFIIIGLILLINIISWIRHFRGGGGGRGGRGGLGGWQGPIIFNQGGGWSSGGGGGGGGGWGGFGGGSSGGGGASDSW
jgi:uncharacterized protein